MNHNFRSQDEHHGHHRKTNLQADHCFRLRVYLTTTTGVKK